MSAKEELVMSWEGIIDKRIIDAFMNVRREDFVIPGHAVEAYGDYPLSIGHGQTISQPTTVMLMLQSLELRSSDKVLEIGCGSGYNAALMSKLVKHVYTVEIVPELAAFARKNLKLYRNVTVINGDGSSGYSKEAPYDRIIVTCGAPKILDSWKGQLKENGIIVVPVGLYSQRMIKGVKRKGDLKEEYLGEFRFVPLTGEHGC